METYERYETIPEDNYYIDGLELKKEEFKVLESKYRLKNQSDEHPFEYDFFPEEDVKEYPDWN